MAKNKKKKADPAKVMQQIIRMAESLGVSRRHTGSKSKKKLLAGIHSVQAAMRSSNAHKKNGTTANATPVATEEIAKA